MNLNNFTERYRPTMLDYCMYYPTPVPALTCALCVTFMRRRCSVRSRSVYEKANNSLPAMSVLRNLEIGMELPSKSANRLYAIINHKGRIL